MALEPVNTDHSVALCHFACTFDRSFSTAAIQALGEADAGWRLKLPAAWSEAVEDFTDSILPLATPRAKHGLCYAVMRPDGTPVWQVRIFRNMVDVLCTRYSRWAPTWAEAKSYFEQVFGILETIEPDRRAQAFGLKVVDQFSGSPRYNAKNILQANSYIPTPLLDAGPRWYSNTGWLTETSSELTIENLEVTAHVSEVKEGAKETFIASLILEHMIQKRLDESTAARVGASLIASFDVAANVMHAKNKLLLGALLTPEVQQRIQLNGKANDPAPV